MEAAEGGSLRYEARRLSQVDPRVYGDDAPPLASRAQAVERMIGYAAGQRRAGVPLRAIVRHMLGLYHGRPGARAWRRTLSDSALLAGADETLLRRALETVEAAAQSQPPDAGSGCMPLGAAQG